MRRKDFWVKSEGILRRMIRTDATGVGAKAATSNLVALVSGPPQ